MSKLDLINKMLDGQDAARASAATLAGPALPRAPHPDDGRSSDRASGREYMLVKNIAPDPDQPRKDIDADEVSRIAASFKTHGQLQPLRIEWKQDLGKWQIEDGQKRWMAAQAAGMDKLWVMFIQKATPEDERLEKQLVANCLRSDLKPIERAQAYQRLINLKGWTQQQVAVRLLVSQPTVATALQLLDLPAKVQEKVVTGELPPTVAAEICKLTDPADQERLADQFVASDMSRADVAEVVKAKSPKRRAAKPSKVVTQRLKGCKGTLAFRKPPTPEQIRSALVEWLDTLGDEQQAAA